MFSVKNKNKNITRLLLQKGANVNHKDIDGFSVLAVAIDSMNLDICKILLEYKPSLEVNIKKLYLLNFF